MRGTDLYGYVAEVDNMIATTAFAMEIPLVRSLLFSPLIFGLIGPKPTDKKGIGRGHGVRVTPSSYVALLFGTIADLRLWNQHHKEPHCRAVRRRRRAAQGHARTQALLFPPRNSREKRPRSVTDRRL